MRFPNYLMKASSSKIFRSRKVQCIGLELARVEEAMSIFHFCREVSLGDFNKNRFFHQDHEEYPRRKHVHAIVLMLHLPLFAIQQALSPLSTTEKFLAFVANSLPNDSYMTLSCAWKGDDSCESYRSCCYVQQS